MLINSTPKNSFYKFDNMQIYTNENNMRFFVLADNEIKMADAMPIDLPVEESTRESFIQELKKASIKTGMSHLLQEDLLEKLQQ
jgi:hypothetical protein